MSTANPYKMLEYQTMKVDSMLERIKIRTDIALQAPTGAGKTIIMSFFLDKFLDENLGKYCYMWFSPRVELPKQSREKIEKFFTESEKITTILRDDIWNDMRGDQIWFANWEYVIRLLGKKGESAHSLRSIIQNIKDKGLKIMLIIDESHWGAESIRENKVKAVIDTIDPDKKIHITATPKGNIMDNDPITHDQVRDAGMIVNTIRQNPGMKNDDVQVNQKLIEEGINRRKRLEKKYKERSIFVNPLLLIQVPNVQRGNDLIDMSKTILATYGITEAEKNLLVWTAEHQVRENDVRENTSEIDVLIFKQAISLGWDCPRAKILVGLRTLKDDSFGIQTLGRILRTPEQKHYTEDEELNECYLYSSSAILGRFQAESGVILDTKNMSIRNDFDPELNLPRYYAKNIDIRDFKDKFEELFREKALEKTHNGQNIADAMTKTIKSRTTEIIRDREIDPSIKFQVHDTSGKMVELRSNHDELVVELEAYVKNMLTELTLGSLYDHKKITEFLMSALHDVFTDSGYSTDCDKECKPSCDKHYHDDRILNVILSDENNKELLKHPLTNTMNELGVYRKELQKKEPHIWNISTTQIVSMAEDIQPDGKPHRGMAKDYTEQFGKYLMKPAYLKMDSSIEINFSRWVNSRKNVEWWYKNDTTGGSFGILYQKEGELKHNTFMPDFIIKMNDGRIGIFDTKGDQTLLSSKEKAEGLVDYIKDHDNLRLFGGIVIYADDKWKVHDTKPFNHNLSDVGWKELDL